MNVGISAMWLCSASTSKNSGLSRYAYHLISALQAGGSDRLTVYAPQGFEPPGTWSPAAVRPVPSRPLWRRLVEEHLLAGPRTRGHDLWFSATPAMPLRAHCPTVVMVHDLIPLAYPEAHRQPTVLYTAWSLALAVKRADAILTNSEATRQALIQRFGVRAERAVGEPLGPGNVAGSSPPGVLETYGLAAGGYLLTVGNLEPRKNLGVLVEAFTELRGRHPALRLAIVGAKRDPAEANLSHEGVSYLGYVPDEHLPALFVGCAAFVFPSLYEGFGMPVLEAMGQGAPTLAADIPSSREVGGDAVRLFEGRSRVDLVRQLEELLGSEAHRNELAHRGRIRAAEFTWERTAEATRRVWSEVVGR